MKNLVVLFIALTNLIYGQKKFTVTSENYWTHFKYDVKSIFGGMGYAYSRPLYWQGNQWFVFSGVATGTAGLYLFDEESSNFFRNQKEYIPTAIRDYGFKVGSPENNYVFTGGVYLTGLFTKNVKLRRTGVLLISSASAAGLLQQVAKTAIGRSRPSSSESKDVFAPFSFNKGYDAFPSGHTILAFTNAYAIAKQFNSCWVKSALYAIGIVPGITRLWEGKHWLSDVAVGVAISIFTVEGIDKYLDKRYNEKYNSKTKKISYNLNFAPGQVGVVLNF